jgi:hypothetical protein
MTEPATSGLTKKASVLWELISIYSIRVEAEHEYLNSIEINLTRFKRCKVAS